MTLSSRNGALLLAFVALFVALAASAIWRIVAFLLHQLRSTQKDRDGLHFQQQAILRTTGSPGKAAWEFLQLFYYWRKRADMTFFRSCGVTIVALLCLAIIGVAGVFSARMVSAYGHETLVVGDHCGWWRPGNVTNKTDESATNLKLIQDVLSAESYANECYGTNDNSPQCAKYYKRQLSWTSDANASCPFAPEICRPNISAIALDTGRLNSFNDFGWNTPESDRVEWRKRTSCANLARVGYSITVNVTVEKKATGNPYYQYGTPGDVFDFWQYGYQLVGNETTFFYNHHTAFDNVGYGLKSVFSATRRDYDC